MAGTTTNARSWTAADVYTAPLGTTAPTDVSTAWASVSASWLAVGLLSEDGMSLENSETITRHYAYGNIYVRAMRSKRTETFKFAVLEDNTTVFGLLRPGSSYSTSGGVTTRTLKSPTTNIRAFGLERVDGSITSRLIIPRGEVMTVGPETMTDDGLVMRELTVEIYAGTSNVLAYEVTNDTQAA